MSADPNSPPSLGNGSPTLDRGLPGLERHETPKWQALLRQVFSSPDGLRSGWRFFLYVAMVVVVLLVLGWLFHEVFHSVSPLWLMMIGEVQLLLAGFVPAVVMAQIEGRRPFGAYGLPRSSAFGRLFWLGTIWGIVALSVLMLVLRGVGAFYFGGIELHGLRVIKFAAFYVLLFLLVGFAEEFLLRGYSQFTLTQGMGFWPTAALLSIFFGAVHLGNGGETWIGAAGAAAIGLFFCLTLQRTGTLWFAVGMHASWDWGESFLYSVADSGQTAPGHLLRSSFHGPRWLTGGSVGPEGSVLVFILIAGMWVFFDRIYPTVKYSPQVPNESRPSSPSLSRL